MIRIISLTPAGQHLANSLCSRLLALDAPCGCEHWHKPQPFSEKVQQAFCRGERLLFICATGIVMRTLAPVLNDKYQDPTVLVMDEAGEFVIPLLSGHEGGANHWAGEIAHMMQSQLVMTTAKPYLCPVYSVGMGCERHCPEAELSQLLEKALALAGVSLDQVASINSIDIKADELGLIACAKAYNKPYHTFDVPTLSRVEGGLSSRSEYVYQTVGVYGVAESAALIGAGLGAGLSLDSITEHSELVLEKIKTKKATCAIARAYPHTP